MDAAAGDPHLRVFKALRDSGELTARVNLAINVDAENANAAPANEIAKVKALTAQADADAPATAPGVRARVVKVFLDGVVNRLPTPRLRAYLQNAGTEAAPQCCKAPTSASVYTAARAALMSRQPSSRHAPAAPAPRACARCSVRCRSRQLTATASPCDRDDETWPGDYGRFAALI